LRDGEGFFHQREQVIWHDSASARVVGEVHFDKDTNVSILVGEFGKKRLPIDGVDHIRVLGNRFGLIGLQLTLEMPHQVKVGCLSVFGDSFLVTVFTEVALAKRVKLANEGYRVKFGHHNRGDVRGVSPGCPGNLINLRQNPVVSALEGVGGLVLHR
jgi:hypothetical protein